jgi:cell division protein FtsL
MSKTVNQTVNKTEKLTRKDKLIITLLVGVVTTLISVIIYNMFVYGTNASF